MARRHRLAAAMLALVVVITLLPEGALPPGPAALRPGAALAAELAPSPSWYSAEDPKTQSLAWGDVDDDGDLDLAVGNYGTPNRMYRNESGMLTTRAAWSSAEEDNTQSVAWGDVDGDGDLDLAIGNYGQPNRLYRNSGGKLSLDTSWSPVAQPTESVAWGDVDGDGDLDLAVGNYGQPNRLYRNCTVNRGDGSDGCVPGDTGLRNTAFWSSTESDNTKSVAWGDVDGDGDLDLAVGNTDTLGQFNGQPNRLYRNDNGTLTASAVWSSSERDATNSVAWGDVDGDGDLDLAVGNGDRDNDTRHQGQPNRLYRNCTVQWGGDGCATGDTGLKNTAFWSSAESENTQSVAWGDVDGDGDLDLAVGNGYPGPSRVYRNNGAGILMIDTTWTPPTLLTTTVVALGDVEGDGDLDLVMGAWNQPSQLYHNDGTGILVANAAWSSAERENTQSVAWGDGDGDGDLDLAVGNNGQPNRLYRNSGGKLSLDTSWSPVAQPTESVAWGDADGDGDLDLAVGNNGQPNRLYRNCTVQGSGDGCAASDTGLRNTAFWSSAESDNTTSLAWGDVDGDGDLDLAAGNWNQSNRLYRNDGTGILSLDTTWNMPAQNTYSLAWGDVDGDGDLDLAAGNLSNLNRLYRNDNGTLTSSAIWTSAESDNTHSIAWGDVDGDDDLDLAVGNGGQPNRLYRNDNGTLTTSAVWSSAESDNTYSVAWGNFDGDGDLDLAAGNFGQPNRIYRNDKGMLSATTAWSSAERTTTTSLAWGEVDGDGDLDLAVGNYGQPNRIYQNLRNNPKTTTPPAISIAPPAATPPLRVADGLSTPQILIESTLTFTYTLHHPTSVPARRLRAQYSLDGGGSWHPAAPAVIADPGMLSSSPAGENHVYLWDTAASGVFGQTDQALLRLIADPIDPEIQLGAPGSSGPAVAPKGLASWGLPGPFLDSSNSATSPQFRLRGTIARVVDPANKPFSGAPVYRLPAGQVRGATQLINWLTGATLASNLQGYVASRDPLLPGDRLTALTVISATDKFTLYNTSPIDIDTGLPAFVINAPGEQTLVISPDRPLLALKLSISLEWDARDDAAFLLQLKNDLARTSELLYDWSDGQVVLGSVTLYHDKERWEDHRDAQGQLILGADIQIAASNRLRPNATQGGIVLSDTIDPDIASITYTPGSLRMPASWNRNGDPGGAFGEDWPRTLAHELSHYALFLDDNYLGLDTSGNLINVAGCPGAMSDPYSDLQSEYQPDGQAWQPGGACAQTLSARSTGRSDWATISRFYPQLRAPSSFDQHPGPARLALALLQIEEPASARPLDARTLSLALVVQDAVTLKPYQPSPAARAVLYHSDGQRAIDLGTPTADLLLARGARNGDTVCVYDTLQDLNGCLVITNLSTQLILRADTSWRPELQLTPVNSTTVRLNVPAGGVGGAPDSFMAQIFPNDGPPLTVTLSLADGSYQASATASTPIFGALVRLWEPGAQNTREVVADYSLGGEPAPRRRKSGRSRRRAPALSADGQAILFTDNLSFSNGQFYAFQSVDRLPSTPAPPSWGVPVGLGYRLSASDDTLRGQIPRAALAISYFGADVPPDAEAGITVYYLPKNGTTWQALSTVVNTDENTASAKAVGEGLYVLLASVPMKLQPGWNLVLRYPGATQSLPEALAGAAGRYSLVYSYDDGDPDDPWKLYAPGLSAPWDGIVNDLAGLQNSGSYWIRSTASITAPLRPSLNAGDAILNAPPATYYGLATVDANGPLSVEALVGPDEVPCGSATTQAVSFNGQAGQGFSINVLANGSGLADGCGYPGADVQLVFSDGAGRVGSYRAVWDNTQLIYLALPDPTPAPRTYLPLVVQLPQATPDLQIVGVTLSPAPSESGEDYELRVIIRNAGSAPVDVPFWVDLYIDPDQAPQPGEGWPDVAAFGASWRVYDLAAGESLMLSSLDPNDPRDPGRNYTRLPAFLQGVRYTIYVQADAYAPSGAPDGAVSESNEDNNIGGPYQLTARAR